MPIRAIFNYRSDDVTGLNKELARARLYAKKTRRKFVKQLRNVDVDDSGRVAGPRPELSAVPPRGECYD